MATNRPSPDNAVRPGFGGFTAAQMQPNTLSPERPIAFRGRGGGGGRRGGGPWRRDETARDLEYDLLHLIVREFQRNCTTRRRLEDIYYLVKKDDAELFAKKVRVTDDHADPNKYEKLRRFIEDYTENFRFDRVDPETVHWNARGNLVAKTDAMAPVRSARREWNKRFDQALLEKYDPVFDEAIVRFVLALFDRMQTTILEMKYVSSAVRRVFESDGEILDYFGGDCIGKFLGKRNHVFTVVDESIFFMGAEYANCVFALNEKVREYADNNRNTPMPVNRLHYFFSNKYLHETEAAFKALESYASVQSFKNFLSSNTWTFRLDEDDGHVTSRRSLHALPWRVPLTKEWTDVVDLFEYNHPKQVDYEAHHSDDDDIVYSSELKKEKKSYIG